MDEECVQQFCWAVRFAAGGLLYSTNQHVLPLKPKPVTTLCYRPPVVQQTHNLLTYFIFTIKQMSWEVILHYYTIELSLSFDSQLWWIIINPTIWPIIFLSWIFAGSPAFPGFAFVCVDESVGLQTVIVMEAVQT